MTTDSTTPEGREEIARSLTDPFRDHLYGVALHTRLLAPSEGPFEDEHTITAKLIAEFTGTDWNPSMDAAVQQLIEGADQVLVDHLGGAWKGHKLPRSWNYLEALRHTARRAHKRVLMGPGVRRVITPPESSQPDAGVRAAVISGVLIPPTNPRHGVAGSFLGMEVCSVKGAFDGHLFCFEATPQGRYYETVEISSQGRQGGVPVFQATYLIYIDVGPVEVMPLKGW